MKKYLKNLNEEQLEAAVHQEGPCMVLAGPGTGKTTVITARVCNLIENRLALPGEILVVTFSKAAATEMKNRFLASCGQNLTRSGGRENEVTFGTFHSVFFRILKQYKGYKLENLIDEAQKFNIVKSIARRLKCDFCEDDDQLNEVLGDIGFLANTLTEPGDYEPTSCRPAQFRQILDIYTDTKQNMGKFDYDDMLLDCYYLLRRNMSVLRDVRNKYKFLLIDEFQDINTVQFETIKLITEPCNNIFVVGDDDQSIYRFRGATPDILMSFEHLYPNCRKVFLKKNYRTTSNLLSPAMTVINCNKNRYPKELVAERGTGSLPVILDMEDFEDEGKAIALRIKKKHQEGVRLSEMAVVYRTNLQSRAVIDALMDQNIPFNAFEGAATIYNHWIFKDVLAYFRLSQGGKEIKDFIRILNKPKRFISREAMEKAEELGGDFINNLICYCGLNNLQVNALYELQNHIKRIGGFKACEAVRFIRSVVGYDSYLSEYAAQKGINIKGLLEVLEEIEGSSEGFDNIFDYMQHVAEVESKLFKQRGNSKREDRVELLTMHRAKGLEFEVVLIAGAVEGLTPYFKEEQELAEALEEERRLFYVAMTRAKNELYISVPRYRYKKRTKASRFIEELSKTHIDYKKQLEKGKSVYHKIYELGVVEDIKEGPDGTRAVINFSGKVKELNLNHCFQKDLIKIVQ